MRKVKSFLCVANWDSNVGYAWWLMESFWVEIAKNNSNKFNVILAYPSITKIPEAIKAQDFMIRLFDFNRKGLQGLWDRLRFISDYNIGVIYFTDKPVFSLYYFLYRLVGVKKIIIHDHSPGLRDSPQGVKRIVKCIRARLPWFNADVVIGATDFVMTRNINVGCVPRRKCYSAPNGIPDKRKPTEFGSNAIKRFNIDPRKKIVVTVARANFYKGGDFALHVIRELIYNKSLKDVHYLYVGDGPDLDDLIEMSLRLGLNDYTTFAGRQNDITDILSQCYIAMHPSKGEVGYSLSIVEYMQAGLPVVVPNNPSVCGATIDNVTGLIYKEGDVSDACNKIFMLLNNKGKRERMSHQAIKIAKEKYSIEECHNKFNLIMQTVLRVN